MQNTAYRPGWAENQRVGSAVEGKDLEVLVGEAAKARFTVALAVTMGGKSQMDAEMFLPSLSPVSSYDVPSPAGRKWACTCSLPSWIRRSSLSRWRVSYMLLFSILASPGRHQATWGSCCWAFCSAIIRTAWTSVRDLLPVPVVLLVGAFLWAIALHKPPCFWPVLGKASRLVVPGFLLAFPLPPSAVVVSELL